MGRILEIPRQVHRLSPVSPYSYRHNEADDLDKKKKA
jgi:hypothetical protein